MRMESKKRLESLFVRGETRRLAEIPLSTFEKAGRPELLVGALALSGSFDRALAIGEVFEAQDETGLVAFHLALGFSRAGRHEEAAARIQRLDDKVADGGHLRAARLLSFYRAQAKGFSSYTLGDSEAAIEQAREALVAAEASNDILQPLARTLSLDLLGHSLIRRGQIRRGLKTLKLAREAAQSAKHENFVHAISISVLKYEALYGLEPLRVLARLSRALVELKPNDSYSRSELRLELARQLIIRGRTRDARLQLELASHDILGSQNFMQTAALHMRLAWISRLEGRPADALMALRSAEIETSREWQSKISYFRLDLLRELGRMEEARDLELSLKVNEGSMHGIEARLVRRRFKPMREPLAREVLNEDPFGDLLDRVSGRSEGVEKELLLKGYFGLLLPLLGIHLGQSALVLGAPSGGTIVLSEGEVRLGRGGLTGLLGKLLVRLADGPCGRREAIESIWGHAYEAERHDRLLAVAVSRIRKALGGGKVWLELQEDRIVLERPVAIRFWSQVDPTWAAKPVFKATAALFLQKRPLDRRLRTRQLQVLDDLVTRGDVGVQDLVERFGISRASALRDLNELVELGLILRTGETRATRYIYNDNVRDNAGHNIGSTMKGALDDSDSDPYHD